MKKLLLMHNLMLSAICAECFSKIYDNVTGWRFWLIWVLIFLLVFRVAYDLLTPIYRKEIEEDDRSAGKTRGRGAVSGKPWHAVRYTDIKQDDRDFGYNLKTL